jgi:hypothetical protein
VQDSIDSVWQHNSFVAHQSCRTHAKKSELMIQIQFKQGNNSSLRMATKGRQSMLPTNI